MPSSTSRNKSSKNRSCRYIIRILLSATVMTVLGGWYWQHHQLVLQSVDTMGSSLMAQWEAGLPARQSFVMKKNDTSVRIRVHNNNNNNNNRTTSDAFEPPQVNNNILPPGFQSVLQRSIKNQQYCNAQPPQQEVKQTLSIPNLTEPIADLPPFGIIAALQNYTFSSQQQEDYPYECILPPSTECNETQFTVVFMGYNPDRLGPMKRQIVTMTKPHSKWNSLVKEIIVVWNGSRNFTSTKDGQYLFSQKDHTNIRFFFPLLEGFPNDLMNRYHPRFNITTKCILFYDDDGPFYSYDAVLGGFELWKRHSNAQMGAMARKIDFLGKRQQQDTSLKKKDEFGLIPHCLGDVVRYNFYEFANYQARMVLPSGSMLHSNYLCFLWHPALEEIRHFVRQHPVHPDDITVSTILSHVSRRAPKVYSRRINDRAPPPQTTTTSSFPRRKLLWQDVNKEDWATMRSMAVNSLVSYFGGINAGSLGWCHDTPYQQVNSKGQPICEPWLASKGMLPWMTDTHEPKETCP